jgi:hypothetical protein
VGSPSELWEISQPPRVRHVVFDELQLAGHKRTVLLIGLKKTPAGWQHDGSTPAWGGANEKRA